MRWVCDNVRKVTTGAMAWVDGCMGGWVNGCTGGRAVRAGAMASLTATQLDAVECLGAGHRQRVQLSGEGLAGHRLRDGHPHCVISHHG